MPIFEFTCTGCGGQFEEIMTFAEMEAGEAACPDCGSRKVQRGLSSFATGTGAGATSPPCGAPSGSCGTSGFG